MIETVKAEVTRQNLAITPKSDGSEIEETQDSQFEVTVTNQSQEFTSFQVALVTADVATGSTLDWYKVEPKVCAKKPPGATTTFQVRVVRSPLPVYDTTINLWLKVFSIEHRKISTTQKLTLRIKKPQQPVNLVLPNRDFKAAPGDQVNIPVLIYNHSPQVVDVTLRCTGLTVGWLQGGEEQTLRVKPNSPTTAIITCCLPNDPGLLKQRLPFTIEARSDANLRMPIPPEQGVLEISPAGVIEFKCRPKQLKIPPKQRPAAYQVDFKNASNCPQRVQLQISEAARRAGFTLPEAITLEAGATSQPLLLTPHQRRHWFGFRRTLQFDLTADILDAPDSQTVPIRTLPSHHSLELVTLPRIPAWLLLAGGLVVVGLFWLHSLLNPPAQHRATVNSVRFNGIADNVFSGASDGTIRQWKTADPIFGRPQLNYQGEIGDTQPKPQGENQERAKRAVRVIRLKPESNDEIAVGLENGTIELWDILQNKPSKTILNSNDRVFDLDFSRDSKYLFSGHGSSFIKQWNLKTEDEKPVRTIVTNFSITSVVASPTPAESFVVIAGQFNKLIIWHWDKKSTIDEIPIPPRQNVVFQPVGGQHQYIVSLAIANTILVIADNQGYITLFDWPGCVNAKPKPPTVFEISQNGTKKALETRECQLTRIDESSEGHSRKPVRSVAITPEGDYLASVGDDGRVNLWSLKHRNLKLLKTLATFPESLHSVDIKTQKGLISVTSDAPNHQIKLYRESINSYAD